MGMKKVKLQWIIDDRARRETYRKRVKNLLKKVNEISVLCGVDACAMVYSPYDHGPLVWPSSESEVAQVLRDFRCRPENDQSKKILNQPDFLQRRVAKSFAKLAKQRRENTKMEAEILLNQLMSGVEDGLRGLNIDQRTHLDCTIDDKLMVVRQRLEAIRGPPPQPSAAPAVVFMGQSNNSAAAAAAPAPARVFMGQPVRFVASPEAVFMAQPSSSAASLVPTNTVFAGQSSGSFTAPAGAFMGQPNSFAASPMTIFMGQSSSSTTAAPETVFMGGQPNSSTTAAPTGVFMGGQPSSSAAVTAASPATVFMGCQPSSSTSTNAAPLAGIFKGDQPSSSPTAAPAGVSMTEMDLLEMGLEALEREMNMNMGIASTSSNPGGQEFTFPSLDYQYDPEASFWGSPHFP